MERIFGSIIQYKTHKYKIGISHKNKKGKLWIYIYNSSVLSAYFIEVEKLEGMRNINVKILKNVYFSEEFKKHLYSVH